MKVRIVAQGFETFTGSLGFQAEFKDGVSVGDLNERQVSRIGSNLRIIDIETGLQVGPSVSAAAAQSLRAPVFEEAARLDVDKAAEIAAKEELVKEEAEQRKAEEEALAGAKEKAETSTEEIVIYSRMELEAIGSNDGIEGLRLIATPLKVKARAISDIIEAILSAQIASVAS